MRTIIEIPPFDELYTSFELVHNDPNIDGMALEGNSFLEEYWEDVLDYAECPWVLFRDLLSHDIATKLAGINNSLRQEIINHALKTLKRTGSFDLNFVSLNLAIDNLAWPNENKIEIINEGLAIRKSIIESIIPTLELSETKLCLPLRLPVPSIAKETGELVLKLIKDIDHKQVTLMLHIVLDELKTSDPEQIEPFLETAELIAFQYVPKLGIKMDESMHEKWSGYLKSKNFDGTICFIPVDIQNQELFDYDLNRTSKNIKTYW